MTSGSDADRAALVDALVATVRAGDRSAAGLLASVARRLDDERSNATVRSPLTIPLLDALALGSADGAPDAGATRARATGTGADRTDPPAALDVVEGVHPDVLATAGPELLGQVHEAVLELGHRRRRGVFYTPLDVASGLVEEVFDRADRDRDRDLVAVDGAVAPVEPPTVCDPALGGGIFLLAAADALLRRGFEPAVVVERCLWGVDIDPLAVAVTEAALVLWARAHGVDEVGTNVVCADTLERGPDAWERPPAGGFTMVIGNPPFQNQLGTGTARTVDGAAQLRDRWGSAVFRYADSAALFLLAATRMAAPGGRVALIVPVSVLVTDDADKVRRDLLDHAELEHLWIANDAVFAVGVRVCAPVLRITAPGDDRPRPDGGGGSAPTGITRSSGRTFTTLPPATIDRAGLRALSTWAVLVADASGVPALAPALGPGSGRLGDICTATAGFRDQYYGLRPFVRERDDCDDGTDGTAATTRRWAKLVTSGLIDPARGLWGTRRTRFDGRSWEAPMVDLAALAREDPSLAAWAAARLVPKVVVATQTRVLEAAVDVDGDWFPSVPTISLQVAGERLWDAAAVVLAPPTTVWAMNRHIGAVLSADAIKVSARQLLDAPLPADREAWSRGAALLRVVSSASDAATWREGLEQFGREMTLAYAAPDEVLSWWLGRLPRWR